MGVSVEKTWGWHVRELGLQGQVARFSDAVVGVCGLLGLGGARGVFGRIEEQPGGRRWSMNRSVSVDGAGKDGACERQQ